jgi:hypothetical protein
MKQFISEKSFPHKHFTTTKTASNMKDEGVRKSFFGFLKVKSGKAGMCRSNSQQ